MTKKLTKCISTAAFITVLAACNSGGGSGGDNNTASEPSPAPTPSSDIKYGYFIDSPVEGLKYKTETQSGYTNPEGRFTYKENEQITFSVGGITLPAVSAQNILTPQTLAGDDESIATDITRFMLSLDSQYASRDSIVITNETHQALTEETGLNFGDTNFTNKASAILGLVNDIEGSLVDESEAKTHLNDTLNELNKNPTIPEQLTANWLAGKTLYAVWYGDDAGSVTNRAFVEELTFGEDNTVSGNVIYGGQDYYEGYYQVIDGKLRMSDTPNQFDSSEYNVIACGSTPYYIKTHFVNNNEVDVDDVDLLFFNKERALSYAQSLTGPISRCLADVITVPYANISVDGNKSDWDGIQNIETSVKEQTGKPYSGLIAKKGFIAQDNDKVYMLYELEGVLRPEHGSYNYSLHIEPTSPELIASDATVTSYYTDADISYIAQHIHYKNDYTVYESNSIGSEITDPSEFKFEIAVIRNYIEFSLDRDLFKKGVLYNFQFYGTHFFLNQEESTDSFKFVLHSSQKFYFE